MIADLLSKLEDDEKERQAKFQKLPPAVRDGINRRAYLSQYVGPLAPMVDQFSSPDRAAATSVAGLILGQDLVLGTRSAIQRLGQKPKPGQSQIAEQVGRAALAVPGALRSLRQHAPEIGAGVLRAAPAIAAELTGVPAFMRAEEAAQKADAVPSNQRGRASLASIGETASGAASLIPGLGLGAKAAKLGTSAKLAKAAQKSVPALAAVSGLAALGSRDAIAQEPTESVDHILDDLLRDSTGRPALRVGDVDVSKAGFSQGLSLNNKDDLERQGPREKAMLDRLRQAAKANPQDTAIQLDLLRAEREYDPIAFAQRLDPQKFHDARLAGEVTAGVGTAALSALLGAKAGPIGKTVFNLGFGAAKGAAYGYGAGVGEIDPDERLTRAGVDGTISGLISGLSVPAAKGAGRAIDHAPIHVQQAKNLARRLEAQLSPGRLAGSPGPSPIRPAVKTTARLTAPKVISLKPNSSALDAFRAAISADGQQPFAYPRPLGQGRTERALLDLARSKPGGAATLERGTQQAQTPAIKQALARLALPASGNRRVPQKGLERDLLDSAFDFGKVVSKQWTRKSQDLAPEQQAVLARSILRRAASQPMSTIQHDELARRLTALGVRNPDAPRGQLTRLIDPSVFEPHHVTQKPGLDRLTRLIKGDPIKGVSPGSEIAPETAQKLADAANASRRLGYIPEASRPPVGDFFRTRRVPGYAPKSDRQGVPDTLAKLTVLGASVPLTDAFDDLAGYREEEVSPIPGAQPGFLSRLAFSENAQALTRSQEDLGKLQLATQANIDREIGLLRRTKKQISARLREAQREALVRTGPDGEDLSRQARRAAQRAQTLQAQLADLESEENVRERLSLLAEQHTTKLDQSIQKSKTRAQVLRDLQAGGR